jgi:hypothetical protein
LLPVGPGIGAHSRKEIHLLGFQTPKMF